MTLVPSTVSMGCGHFIFRLANDHSIDYTGRNENLSESIFLPLILLAHQGSFTKAIFHSPDLLGRGRLKFLLLIPRDLGLLLIDYIDNLGEVLKVLSLILPTLLPAARGT